MRSDYLRWYGLYEQNSADGEAVLKWLGHLVRVKTDRIL